MWTICGSWSISRLLSCPASAPKSEGQEAENDDDPPGIRADDPPGAHVASWTPGLVQNVKVETT